MVLGHEGPLKYYDLESPFTPLPKYGHLSEKTPELVAVEDAISAAYAQFYSLPDIPTFREAAGAPEAVMPPGGPDRRDVVTELLRFPARDGHMVELKVYKSPDVIPDATLVYRMHGGGMCELFIFIIRSSLNHLSPSFNVEVYLRKKEC